MKSDIRLPRIGGFAEDGSYQARLSGGGTTLTMRVVEYHVSLDGQTHARAVGSDRGALPGSLLVGFPGPPAAPVMLIFT